MGLGSCGGRELLTLHREQNVLNPSLTFFFVVSTITCPRTGFCTQGRPKANEFQRFCLDAVFTPQPNEISSSFLLSLKESKPIGLSPTQKEKKNGEFPLFIRQKTLKTGYGHFVQTHLSSLSASPILLFGTLPIFAFCLVWDIMRQRDNEKQKKERENSEIKKLSRKTCGLRGCHFWEVACLPCKKKKKRGFFLV